MKLQPRESSKLLVNQAGMLAQSRLSRGLRLNHPEAMALIASVVLELAREGQSVAQVMDLGRQVLGKRQVMAGVPSMIKIVQIEATFPDGTKLVSVNDPICYLSGKMELAFLGSPFSCSQETFDGPELNVGRDIPGQVVCVKGDAIEINKGRETLHLTVANLDDRAIQVGSHFHFTETNRKLLFDRIRAVGFRLNIPAGASVRFEPGEEKEVTLVRIGGKQIVRGGNNIVDGPTDDANIETSRERARKHIEEWKFSHRDVSEEDASSSSGIKTISRDHYAELYGPTVGDRVRLGNTDLWIHVEKDHTVYGDEAVFGGGKVIREGMGMAIGVEDPSTVLEVVITNALIIDYTGIYKADVGIRNGNIVGIGKAGNPDVMEGVDPGMVIGVQTECIAGERLILTAGAIDTHVHFICPQIVEEAVCSGITTLVGGGTGPATGTNATTCTPHPEQIKFMLQATDNFPLNFGFSGKGNSSKPEGIREVISAGAIAMKLHEDWGTTPAAIDNALGIADEMDIQITIHTDTLNEAGASEDSIAAFKGRTIHAYHCEGAGGGHAPDLIRVCGEMNVIPSSTNPTRPFTTNTIDEHLDMLMVCHHLHKDIREDIAFAESRIRGETIAAEDILHDMGAISIISSDAQAMGRVGEVITRTWQTAHKMKVQRGSLDTDNDTSDNERVKRYVAKYTINPAIAHGMSHLIGSIEVGKMADLVLWDPAFFGSKPEIVIKAGMISYAQMGDANASVPTCEPVLMQPQYGATGTAMHARSIAFVSQSAAEQNVRTSYGLKKRVEAVRNCRNITKRDMKLNDKTPVIKVNPETYQVEADGVLLVCESAKSLPLAQTHNLF